MGKHLSEIIDFERDIRPYRIIQIYSGVGSGKNYWVETLAERGFDILLITSRKATADAQAQKLKGSRWINLERLIAQKESSKEPEQKKVIVTNAGIERFFKKTFDLEKPQTYLWDYFDFIILDEAHSLVSDATFTDSPFYVKNLFIGAYSRKKDCKLVFMTGTNDPIKELFKEDIQRSEIFHFIDAYKKCIHVDAKEVYLTYSNQIEQKIIASIRDGQRIIFFANSITRMETMVSELLSLGMGEQEIGIAYSGTSKRNFPTTMLENKEKIRKYIVEQELIPEDIKLFITTSQNKEGVNINNTDVKIMIAESNERSALIQMAGRIRNGLDKLYILYDAQQHTSNFNEAEAELDYYCLNTIKQFCKEKEFFGTPDWNTISFVENKFPYLRYNYVLNCIQFYNDRKKGYIQAKSDREKLENYIATWENGGKSKFEQWFPYSKVMLQKEPSYQKQRGYLNGRIETLLQNGYIGRDINKAEKDVLLAEINQILSDHPYNYRKIGVKKEYKQLKRALSIWGYDINDVEGKRKGTLFRITKLKE